MSGSGDSSDGGSLISARGQVPGTLISDYLLRAVDRPRQLIVLLHGFKQNAKYMMDRLLAVCPADACVLALNGPYPLPERKDDGTMRVGFSWYFYNAAKDDYFIDMGVALELVSGLVTKLGYAELPKRFVGFSQGGYLAPFVALKLGGARQVIGIASEFLHEEVREALEARGATLAWPTGVRADAVHGAKDDIVEAASAQRGFAGMQALGAPGELRVLEGEGHRLTSPMRDAVGALLRL